MQPHSMCAIAFVKFYWNRPEPIVVQGDVVMRVEYQVASGAYKFNEYRLSNIQESRNRRELKMYIIRSSGGISCEITARRNSTTEGTPVVLSHSQQHVSGLREEFNLMKKKISSGMHYNSMKYGNFEGEGGNDHRDRLVMYCDLKKPNGGYVRIPYTLEITSVNYKKAEPEVRAPQEVPVAQTPQAPQTETSTTKSGWGFGWGDKKAS